MSNIIKAESPAYSGDLTVSVTSSLGFVPIDNATIAISYTGSPDSVIQTLTTDDSGHTATVSLPAPNIAYSTEISESQPYSEYNISVTAPGYEPVYISGTEILPDVTAIQPVSMTPVEVERPGETKEDIVIPEHTLYGEYPPKIPEDEVKPVDEA